MPTEEEWNLLEKRFEAWNEKFIISIIGEGNFDKKEMDVHIKARDEIGEIFAEAQLHYLKLLKER